MVELKGKRGVTEININDTNFVSVYGPNGPIAGFQLQNGPILDAGVNGVQVEDLLLIALNRIETYNVDFPCEENEKTIDALKAAHVAMVSRMVDRTKRNALGHNIV